jgi:uncharacterized protein
MRDASAFVGAWPFGLYKHVTAKDLALRLENAGFSEAAVSPLEAVLQPDPMPANRSFLAAIGEPTAIPLIPVPVVNPAMGTWHAQLTELEHLLGGELPAVKVLPNYHLYGLDERRLNDLSSELTEKSVPICVQIRMADERTHHPLMIVPSVSPEAINAYATRFPQLRVLVCGAYLRELGAYRNRPNVAVELSFVESGHLLSDTLVILGPDRVAIGTHSPLHTATAGAAKLDSDELPKEVRLQLADGTFLEIYRRSRTAFSPPGNGPPVPSDGQT